MKLNSIVALLGLSASIGALADPFAAELRRRRRPSAPSPNGEASLQSIADPAFGSGHINVDTGQSSAGLWSSTTPNFATSVRRWSPSSRPTRRTQSFGIWFGTDTGSMRPRSTFSWAARWRMSFVGIGIDNGQLRSRRRGLRLDVQLRHVH